MRSIQSSNQRAMQICAGGYRYLYGAKGQSYTTALVNRLAAAYPSVFTTELKMEALKDADKGYAAIDCSGFVCDVLDVAAAGSAQIRSAAVERLPISKENAKEGMAIWKNGHIAYVGENLNIYEAASTATDMRMSSFEKRAGAFTELLIVKGSALASSNSVAVMAPLTTSAGSPTNIHKIGDTVTVSSYYNTSTDPIEKAIIKTLSGVTIGKVLNTNVHNPYRLDKNGVAVGWCNDGDIRSANAAAQAVSTAKGTNPYNEPTKTVTSAAQAKAKGITQYISSSVGVKWVQWELCEAGYNLTIDGAAGPKTVAAIIAFQQSCKIAADGLAGAITRRYMKAE